MHREFANARAGTASTKKRDEVAGGGRKPWRQKGTGRARHGSIRSPQWRHGGVVFGPQPRDYVESLNKKERRLAFTAALADRFRGDAVTLLDAENISVSKTAGFAALLFGSAKAAKRGPATLIVCSRDEKNAPRDPAGEPQPGARRRHGRRARSTSRTCLRFERIVFTAPAYEALARRLGGEKEHSDGRA